METYGRSTLASSTVEVKVASPVKTRSLSGPYSRVPPSKATCLCPCTTTPMVSPEATLGHLSTGRTWR